MAVELWFNGDLMELRGPLNGFQRFWEFSEGYDSEGALNKAERGGCDEMSHGPLILCHHHDVSLENNSF